MNDLFSLINSSLDIDKTSIGSYIKNNFDEIMQKENGFFTKNAWLSMAKIGTLSRMFPAPFGEGCGWDEALFMFSLISYLIEDESLLLSMLFQLSGVQMPLYLIGSPELKQEYLQPLIEGKLVASHCLTESHAGSDVLQMKTVAKPTHDGWEITGSKTYICNAPMSDMALLYTKTEESLTCFLVDMHAPGIEVGKPLKKIGLQGVAMSEVHFNKVLVREKQILGKPGGGMSVLHMSTAYERIIIPAGFIGKMINIFVTCKKSIASNSQSHQYILSEMYISLVTCISLLLFAFKENNLNQWNRKFILLGCVIKSKLSEEYLALIKNATTLLGVELSTSNTAFGELSNALGAWIYSGTNDVLKSMINKLV